MRLFREVSAERLWRAAEDPEFQERAPRDGRASSPRKTAAEPRDAAARELVARGERIAYFSAEFGLTEVLPIYAGGLGVLAGDLLKSASDLGVPHDRSGPVLSRGLLPPGRRRRKAARPRPTRCSSPTSCRCRSPSRRTASPPVVSVNLAGRNVNLLIRLARVGRVPVLLLDSNLPENEPPDREVTARLYGGGHEMRLQQEIVLGIGGSRALEKVQQWPTIRHINEGHAAFVSLERIRRLVQEEHLTFAEAREVATSGNVFTTHTPVPAGIDVFTPELLWKYFGFLRRRARHLLRRVLRPRPRGRERTAGSSSRWRSSRCVSRRTRTPSRSCTARCRASSGATWRPICRSRRSRSCRSPTACTRRPGPRPRSRRRASWRLPRPSIARSSGRRTRPCARSSWRPAARSWSRRSGGRARARRRSPRPDTPSTRRRSRSVSPGASRPTSARRSSSASPSASSTCSTRSGGRSRFSSPARRTRATRPARSTCGRCSVAAARPEFRGRIVLPVGLRHGSGPRSSSRAATSG